MGLNNDQILIDSGLVTSLELSIILITKSIAILLSTDDFVFLRSINQSSDSALVSIFEFLFTEERSWNDSLVLALWSVLGDGGALSLWKDDFGSLTLGLGSAFNPLHTKGSSLDFERNTFSCFSFRSADFSGVGVVFG